MAQITYKNNGIMINDIFISLTDIIKNCNLQKIKENKLILLNMKWKGWRGFSDGIYEKIILPINSVKTIKKFILGKTIYFDEIAGKHSKVYNALDDNDIEIIEDSEIISDFLSTNPNGHDYNYSFLYKFYDYAQDGGYDDITEEDLNEIENSIFEHIDND